MNKVIKSTVTVYGVTFLDVDGKTDTLINIGKGVFIGEKNDGIFVTLFDIIRSSEMVFIEYGYETESGSQEGKKIIKVFPSAGQKKYYWIDEARNLVVFMLPELQPESALELSDNTLKKDDEVFAINFSEIENPLTGKVISLIRSYFMDWIIPEFSTTKEIQNGSVLIDKSGKLIGIMQVKSYINQNLIWVIPSQYIKFLIEWAKLNKGTPQFGKQISDYFITQDIYEGMVQYEGNVHGKLFKGNKL